MNKIAMDQSRKYRLDKVEESKNIIEEEPNIFDRVMMAVFWIMVGVFIAYFGVHFTIYLSKLI